MTKYFTIDEKNNPMVRILTEDDLREEFNKDHSIIKTEENFKIWKLINASTEYSGFPKYRPFETEVAKNDREEINSVIQMWDAMHYTLDAFFNCDADNYDEVEDMIANDAYWDITFHSPITGKSRCRIYWCANHWEAMENAIDIIANMHDGNM